MTEEKPMFDAIIGMSTDRLAGRLEVTMARDLAAVEYLAAKDAHYQYTMGYSLTRDRLSNAALDLKASCKAVEEFNNYHRNDMEESGNASPQKK